MDTTDTPVSKIRIDHTADDNYPSASELFHSEFDLQVRALMEPVRTTLLESVESCEPAEIVGQLLMNFLNDDGFAGDDPDSAMNGKFNVRQKQNLLAVADHMGPDWCQALYHATVFMTKVA